MSVDDVVGGSKKRILVVDGDGKRLKDAKRELDSREGVAAVYATNYVAARVVLENKGSKLDGIITDLYFPCDDGTMWDHWDRTHGVPYGSGIVFYGITHDLPVVVCTAGPRSDFKICKEYLEIRQTYKDILPFIEPEPQRFEEECLRKDWKRAYDALEAMMR
ncbi:MAG: response regulator [Nanoarchaeota archaeon]